MHDYYERYKRQIMLKDFGKEKQDILKNSSVFIGGIGGLRRCHCGIPCIRRYRAYGQKSPTQGT